MFLKGITLRERVSEIEGKELPLIGLPEHKEVLVRMLDGSSAQAALMLFFEKKGEG